MIPSACMGRKQPDHKIWDCNSVTSLPPTEMQLWLHQYFQWHCTIGHLILCLKKFFPVLNSQKWLEVSTEHLQRDRFSVWKKFFHFNYTWRQAGGSRKFWDLTVKGLAIKHTYLTGFCASLISLLFPTYNSAFMLSKIKKISSSSMEGYEGAEKEFVRKEVWKEEYDAMNLH